MFTITLLLNYNKYKMFCVKKYNTWLNINRTKKLEIMRSIQSKQNLSMQINKLKKIFLELLQ